MTELLVHHRVRYLVNVDVQWRSQDYSARNYVKMTKCEPFNGYVDFMVGGVQRRFNNNNARDFLPILAGDAALYLRDRLPSEAVIVPVPNRQGIVGGDLNFATAMMAADIARKAKLAGSAAAVLWKQALPKQHEAGGRRSKELQKANLKLMSAPKAPVVLFDDFVHTGSQMFAMKEILEEAGCKVLCGVAIGRRVNEQRDRMLGWEEEQIRESQLGLFEFGPI